MTVPRREPVAWPAAALELPETKTYLEVLRTHGTVTMRSAELFREYGVTEQQYHLLRILEEAGPGGLPCLDIARQLPTPAPDVTRLVDRIQRAGLVRRQRLEADRRVVMIELTERGRRAAQRIGPAVARFHRQRLAHMSADELELLARLLRKARRD
jgi:DNA-binding MarR family transcriptional regulator